jgi:hypothetical protein
MHRWRVGVVPPFSPSPPSTGSAKSLGSAWLNLHCQKQRECDYAQNCSADYYLVHRDAITPGVDLVFLQQRPKKSPAGAGHRGAIDRG